MKFKTIAMTGVMSLAGLGLIGAGAHAVFTTTTSANQTITGGSPKVVFFSSVTPGCTTAAENCTSLTLPDVGPVPSTFDSTPVVITEENVGNIPVAEASVQLTDTVNNNPGSYLQDQMNVCIYSDSETVVNGPLTTGLALKPSVTLNGAILGANGGFDSFTLEFYAGQNPTAGCGELYSSGPTTSGRWQNQTGSGWATPASLTSDAEGGSVTVTVTNYGSA
jgi:hypothetical protein